MTTKYNITINMVANMAAFGHISETEVTFLEISAVIVFMAPKGGHIVISVSVRSSVRPSFRPSVRSSQIIFADG